MKKKVTDAGKRRVMPREENSVVFSRQKRGIWKTGRRWKLLTGMLMEDGEEKGRENEALTDTKKK